MESLSYLLNLVGRHVRMYKGGPESKEGLLLYVKDDYLALLSNENEVIYYNTSHLKSVIEDSKTSTLSKEVNENQQILEADSFGDVLSLMKGSSIKVDRGGPNSIKGTLLGIADDYVSIQTEEYGVIHCQTHHIKSVSLDNESSTNVEANYELPAADFSSLLSSFQHSWVSINRGPESVEGVLADMTNNYVTIIHHEKVHRLTNYHIRNICLGSVHDMKKQGQNQGNEQQSESNNNVNENEANANATEQDASMEKSENNQEQVKNSSQKDEKNAKQEKGSSKKAEKSKKQEEGKSEKQDSEKTNRSNKKAMYELILKSLSMNIEETLKKAKSHS